MKFLRVGSLGQEKVAALDNNSNIRDLSNYIKDLDPSTINFESLKKLQKINLEDLPKIQSNTRIGACINKPNNIFCAGLNYSLHAAQTGSKLPDYPIIFNKSTDCLQGPFDPIKKKKSQEKLDYEIELAVVIGREAKNVTEDRALDYVFGYFILNDISDRYAQKVIGQGHWTLGKSWCAPVGALLVTKEHIRDINDINLSLSVNGETRQNGNTKNMIFNISYLISHISKYLTLNPGAVISTGTPAGTGMEQKPQKFLQVGDKLHLKIDGLGEQINEIIED
ncbi:MAG: 2-hydroxyhepta-2,4-diene-1,7-dioate isomerase [Candidatus Pelagibacter sp.]|nr:2-hydroxyhepta-2,4-diene-1,7-dioate isomerase [Candidatus Pelagibacter sp.]OUW24728.1 MAG: 2-hydroxyhepta-2,4-diene-1,7-dioate isomerase [Rickettsiales bacterium TMED174]|tara:strand:+ start:157 stop:996 length:840 start_codon:yes stop_codon:yes gene_type:complete